MCCLGLVTFLNGSQEIVMTTGYELSTGTSTEILNLDTMLWRAGPEFPTTNRTFYGTSLPYGHSFLAIGGYTIDAGIRDEIWFFNPDSYEWELIATMEQDRELFAAIALPDNICQNKL